MEDRLRGLAQEGLYADVEVKNIDVVVSSEKPGFVMLLNKCRKGGFGEPRPPRHNGHLIESGRAADVRVKAGPPMSSQGPPGQALYHLEESAML